jgi:hypothetical protein
MSREIIIAAAQMGPNLKEAPQEATVARMVALLNKAAARGAQLVVFPELALTTFFPRWFMENQTEIDEFFETEMPSSLVEPLFRRAKELGIAFTFGYAEKCLIGGQIRRFNTSIMVGVKGDILSHYRKIHLPGHIEHEPWRAFQHLESDILSREKIFTEQQNYLAANSPWLSAMTAAGRKPIARWHYRARNSRLLVIIRRCIMHRRPNTIICSPFTTIFACKLALIRTDFGS